MKEKLAHSEEIVLTAYHIGILTRQLPNFLAANTNQQEKIVQEAADKIKRMWTGVDFLRGVFIKVCKLSAKHKFSNFSNVSSLYANTCMAKPDRPSLYSKRQNGHTLKS